MSPLSIKTSLPYRGLSEALFRLSLALAILSSLTLELLVTPAARAQQGTPSATASPDPLDLAKSLHNPFEDVVKVPLESVTAFNIGRHHNVGQSLNVEPVIPLRPTANWDLIIQPNLTLAYSPHPNSQFGLEDTQTSFFVTPHNATTWLWGIGPIFQIPTATSRELGTGRWSAGPTGAIIYSNGPWFNGVLAYQLMSFGGDSGRGSVNQTFIEPQLSYNFKSGWYVDTNPSITFDWTAASGNGWTVPVGMDIGKAFNLGSQSMGLEVGSYYLVERPAGSPEWIVRIQLTLLFPTGY